MRNNSIAMLGTVAAVGVLAWWIGFFDPETCPPANQVEGWTSCESISNQRNVALLLLVGSVAVAVALSALRTLRQRQKRTNSQA